MASLSHGLDFDGPFLPAGRVVFLAVAEVFLLGDLLLDLAEVVFLEVVFELEDFGLALELLGFTFFELVAFGEDFFTADFFLVTLGFALDFGLVLA